MRNSRETAKHLLGTVLWPFPTKLVSKFMIGGKRGLILMFHYIGKPLIDGAGNDLFLELAEFRRVLDFVATKLCPLEPLEFLSGLQNENLPRGATLLTFDDCTERTVHAALPEMLDRNLRGCFFANHGLIDAGRTVPCLELMRICAECRPGRYELAWPRGMVVEIANESSRAKAYKALWPGILACPSSRHEQAFASLRFDFSVGRELSADTRLASWQALERLDAMGMLVANHTPFHSTVEADGLDQFTRDVAEGYAVFSERFKSSCRVFCYPYGRTVDATPETAARLKKLRTDFAFVTQGGIARADQAGMLGLRREGAVYTSGSTKLAPLLACIR